MRIRDRDIECICTNILERIAFQLYGSGFAFCDASKRQIVAVRFNYKSVWLCAELRSVFEGNRFIDLPIGKIGIPGKAIGVRNRICFSNRLNGYRTACGNIAPILRACCDHRLAGLYRNDLSTV